MFATSEFGRAFARVGNLLCLSTVLRAGAAAAAMAALSASILSGSVSIVSTQETVFDPASEAAAPAPLVKADGAPFRVGIQAGHWKTNELPSELASLRTATGAAGLGWREVDINLVVARRVVALLGQSGVQADLLPATVPEGYKADAFVALHGDANGNTAASGYKAARATASRIPEEDDALVQAVKAAYQAATGLTDHPQTITQNMRAYYAFNNRRLTHAVDPNTPAIILEMGFLTNRSNRTLLMQQPDLVAKGVAEGILKYLHETRDGMA